MLQDVTMRRLMTVALLGCLAIVSVAEPVAMAEPAAERPSALEAAVDRGTPYESQVLPIPRHIRQLMRGSSWRPGCPIGLPDLRLVRVTYVGFDGEAHLGRLVVHRRWAHPFELVFRRLYRAGFPIRRMQLVDRYGASDPRSMRADNTSAFNCRYRDGVCCTWSMHAYGRAIDINPVENPYIGSWGVSPPNGAPFVDRDRRRRGMIFRHDEVWSAFHAIGWEWGGTWTSSKDYQHFSSNGR
jgi:hypothetical protein